MKVNALAEKEQLKLRKECQGETLQTTQIKVDRLAVKLLNTRSLRKHLDNILINKHILSNVIIGVTKIQLQL